MTGRDGWRIGRPSGGARRAEPFRVEFPRLGGITSRGMSVASFVAELRRSAEESEVPLRDLLETARRDGFIEATDGMLDELAEAAETV